MRWLLIKLVQIQENAFFSEMMEMFLFVLFFVFQYTITLLFVNDIINSFPCRFTFSIYFEEPKDVKYDMCQLDHLFQHVTYLLQQS